MIMQSKYAGKCIKCGERFPVGTRINYDGKASHFPVCGQTTPNIPAPQTNAEKQQEHIEEVFANDEPPPF